MIVTNERRRGREAHRALCVEGAITGRGERSKGTEKEVSSRRI